jgi:hypothetical protein
MDKKILIIIAVLGVVIGSLLAFNSSKSTHEDHVAHMPKVEKATRHHVVPVLNYEETMTLYFKLQHALAKDDFGLAKEIATSLSVSAGEQSDMYRFSHSIHQASDITSARSAFELLSTEAEVLIRHKGVPKGMSVGKYHCPMVDGDRGASWLQNYEGTLNPYFGAMMLKCGSKVETIK